METKYAISKRDGGEIDDDALYLVLRVDGGASPTGVMWFAEALCSLNPSLAEYLRLLLREEGSDFCRRSGRMRYGLDT